MLNSAPCRWTINELAAHIKDGPKICPVGESVLVWHPARPYGLFSLSSRIKRAVAVFRGEADALYWPGQMPKAY